MAVSIRIGDSEHAIPSQDAGRLATELRAYADGYRGDCDDPRPARELATAIDDRISGDATGPIDVRNRDALCALHRVLNAIVHEMGPAMELYSAVDMARRAA
jgi:hypothetical protein